MKKSVVLEKPNEEIDIDIVVTEWPLWLPFLSWDWNYPFIVQREHSGKAMDAITKASSLFFGEPMVITKNKYIISSYGSIIYVAQVRGCTKHLVDSISFALHDNFMK